MLRAIKRKVFSVGRCPDMMAEDLLILKHTHQQFHHTIENLGVKRLSQ